jgi:oxaloacetate decarboxylase alpha subunit
MNIIGGERYKMVPKESKGLLRGEYGKLPGTVNEEVRKKCIGDDKVITCRPADLIQPELAKYREEAGSLAKCEEDVLSYALFPQVASKFLENRNNPKAAAPAAKPADPNAVRELYVEDSGN